MNSNWDENSQIFLCSRMVVCLVGLFTNLIDIIVFFNMKKRTQIQNINIIWSILDLLYLVLCFFHLIVQFTCPETLFSRITKLFIDMYVTSSLAITIICVQIFVFTRHYLLIKKKEMFCIKTPMSVFSYLNIFLTIGFLVYLPVVFMWQIIPSNPTNSSNERVYLIEKTKLGAGPLGEVFSLLITIIRCFLSFVPMIMLNMMIYVKYKKKLLFPKSK